VIDLGISKIALIGVVALIVIGPEKLPRVARTVGTLLGKAQRYVSDVKSEVSRSMELDELKKMKETVTDAAKNMENTIQSNASEMEKSWADATRMDDNSQTGTSYDMPDKLRHINAAGPEAILIKDDTRDCFVQCIRSVAAGGTFLSRAVRDALRIINPARLAFDSLTATQRKVLVLLASAQPDTQVAEALHISVSTLDNHRTPILEKLRAHGFQVYSKAELALWHAQHRHCLE